MCARQRTQWATAFVGVAATFFSHGECVNEEPFSESYHGHCCVPACVRTHRRHGGDYYFGYPGGLGKRDSYSIGEGVWTAIVTAFVYF